MTNPNDSQCIQKSEIAGNKTSEIEIDLLAVAQKIWINKKIIFKVTAIFLGIGFFIAVFSPKEYTSRVVMVPQIGDGKSKAGGLAGLAAMAGVNIGDALGGGDVLSPTIYPKIMASVPFQKDLIYTKVKFETISKKITLYDYYTNEDYQSFNLIMTIKKYTLGLPGLILKMIKGDQEKSVVTRRSSQYLELTKKEERVIKILSKQVSLVINEKEGTLTLSANMPEALVSTELVEATKILLQKYITDFKIDKVKKNLEFVQQRYNEAKKDFEQKQMQLAAFKDGNRNVILASTQATGDRLNSEYSLYFNVYSELAKQLEQAKIKVKDATPVLTVIEPSVVPNTKTKPQRLLILLAYTSLGLVLSILYLLLVDEVKLIANKIKNKDNVRL